MNLYLPDQILLTQARRVLEKKHYKFFDGQELNLIGVRRKDGVVNSFDDAMLVIHRSNGGHSIRKFEITTDPGKFWLENPENKNGTAILIPGQYLATWKIGLHRGQYEALVQTRPVRVWRDSNRDAVLDYNAQVSETGIFGINVHRSNPKDASVQVDKWSAGCQVFARAADFDTFMDLCRRSVDKTGPFFSYTLLDEADFYA